MSGSKQHSAVKELKFTLTKLRYRTDIVIEEPYNEGKSAELLQGLAPYYEVGSASPREDVPIPKGGEIWNRLKSWVTDPEFMWYEGPKVQDFWVQEAGE